MRGIIVSLAALAITMTPAMAQQSGARSSSGQQTGAASQSSARETNMTAMSQGKLKKSLQQAGFKDIEIVDAAYLVHARTDDGHMVVMYIDPPSTISGGQATSGSAASDAASDMKNGMNRPK